MSLKRKTAITFQNKKAADRMAANYRKQFRGVDPPDPKPPEVLNAIADVVLSYRPKSKIKKARKRKKRKKHGS